MKQRENILPKWIDRIMKKRMSISSYRIYQTSFSMYQYSLSRSKALMGIVVLIAFMLTMLTGMIVNVEANWQKSQIRLLGSDAKLIVQVSDDKLLENLYQQKQIESVGLFYPVQEIEEFVVCYADEVCWKSSFLPAVGEEIGQYPQKKNEIMVSRRFLSEIGKEACGIGDSIFIKDIGTFQISGIFTDYSKDVGVQNLYISKEYAEKEDRLKKKNRQAMLTSDLEQYYLREVVKLECEIPSEDIAFLTYQSVDRDSTIVLLKGILVFLFVCGGFSVYHIFYTVVSADQKYYGLFAVIGMSREHIYQCMRWQSVFVAIPGILFGVILGLLGQMAVVPWFMKQYLAADERIKEYLVTEVELYPVIPLISAIIIGGMVVAGFCMVAFRISKLSPMECLKGGSVSGNRKPQRSKSVMGKRSKEVIRSSKKSIWNLAWQYQRGCLGSNLLTGISLFISNNFFLVVWVAGEYFKRGGNPNDDMLQKATSISILGNFIGIVVFCTEMIRFWCVALIQLQIRKEQIDLLHRIGMTGKQLKNMIMAEGILQFGSYVVLAVLLEFPVWSWISGFIKNYGTISVDFPLVLCLLILSIDFVVYISSTRVWFVGIHSKRGRERGK